MPTPESRVKRELHLLTIENLSIQALMLERLIEDLRQQEARIKKIIDEHKQIIGGKLETNNGISHHSGRNEHS